MMGSAYTRRHDGYTHQSLGPWYNADGYVRRRSIATMPPAVRGAQAETRLSRASVFDI